MPKYVLSLDASKKKKKKKKKLACLFSATEWDCPVLEVKGKLKGSPPSDIINRSIKRVCLHVCTAPFHTAPGKILYLIEEKSRIRSPTYA